MPIAGRVQYIPPRRTRPLHCDDLVHGVVRQPPSSTHPQSQAEGFNIYGVITPVQMHVMLYALRANTVVLCLKREEDASGTITYVSGPIVLSYTSVYTKSIAPIAQAVDLPEPREMNPTIKRVMKQPRSPPR